MTSDAIAAVSFDGFDVSFGGFDIVEAAAEAGIGARPFLFGESGMLDYAEMARRVLAHAAWLREAGVARGARVAFNARCAADTVTTILALLHLGATLVPIHPRALPQEAAALAARARVAFRLDAADRLVATPPVGPGPADADGALAIVFTSGTSGEPKAAVLGGGAFAASVRASAANLGVDADERWILCMPLAHVGGLSVVLRSVASRRALIVCDGFAPQKVLAAIEQHGATLLSVVPTMLHALVDSDRTGALRRLRAVLVGGAAAPLPLLDACAERGVSALATYGMTETCSQIATQALSAPGQPPRARAGCGRPLPGLEVRILDAASRALVVGELGRIHVRGATLFRGYVGEPRNDPDALFDTGDDGWVDELGELHVVGRRSDRIVTGGENVDPVEVERALEQSGLVLAALVFAVADERWGQVVSAAVVPAAAFDAERLLSYVVATLSPHKRPRRLARVEALPTTSTGKLDRAGAALRLAPLLQDFA